MAGDVPFPPFGDRPRPGERQDPKVIEGALGGPASPFGTMTGLDKDYQQLAGLALMVAGALVAISGILYSSGVLVVIGVAMMAIGFILILDPPDPAPGESKQYDGTVENLLGCSTGVWYTDSPCGFEHDASGPMAAAMKLLYAMDDLKVANERLQGATQSGMWGGDLSVDYDCALQEAIIAAQALAFEIETLDVPMVDFTPESLDRLVHALDSWRLARRHVSTTFHNDVEAEGYAFLANPATRLAVRQAVDYVRANWPEEPSRPEVLRAATDVLRHFPRIPSLAVPR